ncbi:UNVERIFIED_CONTAM: hypothetical protein GTU68_062140 [Idotea baltica]|nr:hypothetical protein [Idotea baltica]
MADEAAAEGIEVEYMVVGRRMVSAAKSKGWNVYCEHGGLPEAVADWPVSDIARDIITRFTSGEVDEVKLCFTQFKSAMTQEVTLSQLLPFAALSLEGDEEQATLNKYDPSPETILEKLLPLLAQTAFVQAAFESKASEHAARMTAMDAATNNADELIEKLRLYYNRARQSTITSELIDIVGGAEALQ